MTHSFPTRRSSYLFRRRREGALPVKPAGRDRQGLQPVPPDRPPTRRDIADGVVEAGRHVRRRRHRLAARRSEEHTSELQSLMRTSYAVFCLKTTKYNKPMILIIHVSSTL